eukprot:5767665-Pyramimonas_sp.AAC.1
MSRNTGALRLQATCKFHRDPKDKPTTQCTKSRTVEVGAGNFEEVRTALMYWCIAGYGLQHRASEHKEVEPEMLPPHGTYTSEQ